MGRVCVVSVIFALLGLIAGTLIAMAMGVWLGWTECRERYASALRKKARLRLDEHGPTDRYGQAIRHCAEFISGERP